MRPRLTVFIFDWMRPWHTDTHTHRRFSLRERERERERRSGKTTWVTSMKRNGKRLFSGFPKSPRDLVEEEKKNQMKNRRETTSHGVCLFGEFDRSIETFRKKRQMKYIAHETAQSQNRSTQSLLGAGPTTGFNGVHAENWESKPQQGARPWLVNRQLYPVSAS